MAFLSKVGNLLKQSVGKNINSGLSASNPSLYQAVRLSSSKIFIGGLSYSTDDQSLRESFASYGEVIEARVIQDRETGRSRGFGFVSFTSGEEASKAIEAMDGKELHGRMVRVNYATDRAGGFRSGGGGGYGGGGYGGGGYGGGGYGGSGGGSYGGGGYGDGGNNYSTGGSGYNPAGNYGGGSATGAGYGSGGGYDGSSGNFGAAAGGSDNFTTSVGGYAAGGGDGSTENFGVAAGGSDNFASGGASSAGGVAPGGDRFL